MKKLIIICLTLLSSIGFSQPFSATNQVIVNSTNNPPLWGRGFDFTPNVTIYLTQMGKRVPSVATYTWNIWQVNTQTLIHSQTSTSTTPGVYTYENISAPVTLLAGVEYCLTLYGDGNAGAQYYFDPSSQINSNLTYNFMRYCNSCASGVFPTQSLSNYHYGTPDFMFTLTSPSLSCINCGTGAEGAFLASSNTTLAGGIHNYTSFTINPGVTVSVTGSTPLDIRCSGNVNIQGTLAANGGNGGNGVTFSTFGIGGVGVAGGANGGNGSYSSSTGPLPGVAGAGTGGGGAGDGWSGGGGAGYAAAGANSGGVGGFGGIAYGNPQISPVVAGSGGGGGSGGFSCGSGGGGAGGGVISISACGSFTISASGAIRSNGGNGGSDGTGNCGGGGGGSGGSILLSANTINNLGVISAVAGVGGASAVPGSPYFGTGAAGSAGRIRLDYSTYTGGGSVTPAGFINNLNLSPTISGTLAFCSGSTTQLCAPAGLAGYQWNTGATTQCITVSSANTFTVTVTNGSGCTGSTSAVTTVNPSPAPTISGTLAFCSGNSTQLCAPAGLAGYQWNTGATTQCITVSSANTFTVTVTNGNGCTGSTSATTAFGSNSNVDQPANQVVCNNTPTLPVNFTGSGTVFNWTNSTTSIGLAASGTGNIASFNAINATNAPVTATITVTPSGTGGNIIPELLYYKFDGTGTTVPNLASSPPSGTATANIIGAQTQGGSAICNGTLIGTGSAASLDYVNTGWAPNIPVGTSWSLSFKTSNIIPSATLWYILGDINTASFRCFTNGVAGANNWILRGAGLTDILINGGATVAPHTTTFVYDATLNNVKGYLDGVLVTTVVQVTPNLNGIGPFKVGGYASNNGLSPGGFMDEFSLFNHALTSAEVLSLASCGSSCTGTPIAFTITVNPTPTISTTGPLSLNNNVGLCSATVSNAQLMAQVTSVTGTPSPAVTFSPPAGSFPVGTTLVTATATNICGAPTSSFNVIVTDDEDPDIACPPPVVSVNTDPGVCYATGVALGSPVIGDNCAGSTVGNNAPLQFPQGGTYVTWEVTDASGNKADCQQLVSVIDNEPPHAICKNICIYLGSNGLATITGADIDNGSYDNCALDPLNPFTASQTSFSYADAGPNTITLTVLDINGNTSTCTSIVTVGEYYTLFGAGPTCSTPSGQPDACHVHIGNGNTVSGNVGSYRLVSTGGGVAINGNVYSGGKVNYANGVSSKSVAAANLLGLPGLIFQTGNSASITGDVNVQGNININANAGSFVTGVVRHPVGTTYSGPLPGGGVLLAPPVLPALPGMPPINAYSCGGANITTTATLIPGSYGNLTLGNAAGVVITFAGPGNYYFSRISMGQGGIHTFKYDFLGLPGKINIFVCGDIDFGTHYSQWANPNTPDACRVYFETHGTGSTNGTNSVMSAIIALGSQFYGRIWAPYGGIKIGSGSCCTYATGSFWSAKQVQLEGAVTIYKCGSTCPPGPRIGQDGATAEEMKDMLQVYPNPTTGQTTVSFFAETPDNYSLKVMDYQGRVVLSNQIKSIAGDNTVEVDMSQFAKGLYLIEIGNTDHSQKVKLVVQ